ncbi:molybdate ABC transporter permease subunit [Granulosicoccus antarcticus]|uniref:Molybdenum transport system permease n=1 Tax=Granulosicoccus antarcticus IMCC3135 TaxID=1192854 RepID=A0A2Z2NMW1_9GAMM|nr:molybdate ABC transporter permease subunit [Granulosicoccus antarcticus]ASJ72563.1 Molybdenum transport system permease protein ModB [Granulosicoccus antarcticus IMCC3135]
MSPFLVSFKLALWTMLLLLPIGLLLGRWLAFTRVRSKPWIEAILFLPLVLPPTVIGYYLLVLFSPETISGAAAVKLFGAPLVFTFPGLVVASIVVNLPFAVQPIQLAYSTLPLEVREAAWVSGLSPSRTWWHIELPLTWQGMLASGTLVFAHTLGEFGVVLLVGGNIDGVTRTVSIAIYDSVQAFDMQTAGWYSLILVAFSLLALLVVRKSSPTP